MNYSLRSTFPFPLYFYYIFTVAALRTEFLFVENFMNHDVLLYFPNVAFLLGVHRAAQRAGKCFSEVLIVREGSNAS